MGPKLQYIFKVANQFNMKTKLECKVKEIVLNKITNRYTEKCKLGTYYIYIYIYNCFLGENLQGFEFGCRDRQIKVAKQKLEQKQENK